MPYFLIRSNVKINNHETFLQQASALCAKVLNKPEAYVMVSLEDEVSMCFAGASAPTAYIELKSLGLSATDTSNYAQQICDFINQQTSIPANRIYIEFTCGERAMWGFNSGTFS